MDISPHKEGLFGQVMRLGANSDAIYRNTIKAHLRDTDLYHPIFPLYE